MCTCRLTSFNLVVCSISGWATLSVRLHVRCARRGRISTCRLVKRRPRVLSSLRHLPVLAFSSLESAALASTLFERISADGGSQGVPFP